MLTKSTKNTKEMLVFVIFVRVHFVTGPLPVTAPPVLTK
jgi:hypothetical protein